MTKRLILALLLSCSPLWATTYYVDNCVTVGNDRNNGTSTSTPWLTINKVNTSTFYPGDSILFQSTCTWREQLSVASSGSSGSPITFGAYGSGAAPIIDGTKAVTGWSLYSGSIYQATISGYTPRVLFEDASLLALGASAGALTAGQYFYSSGTLYVYTTAGDNPSGHTMEATAIPATYYALIQLNGVSYITIQGLALNRSNWGGIYIYPGAAGITIQNNTFTYNVQNDVDTQSYNGEMSASSNISILNNACTNSGLGRSRGYPMGMCVNLGSVNGGTVSGNSSINQGGEGLGTSGNNNNIIFSNNYVSASGGIGIYICAGYPRWTASKSVTNTTVEYNYVTGSAITSYELASEVSGGNVTYTNFFGNVSVNPGTENGLAFGNGVAGTVLQNNAIYNNTFYGGPTCEAEIEVMGPTTDTSNSFKNNILEGCYFSWQFVDSNVSNYSPDYELLYGASYKAISYNGTNYATLAAFQTATGKMAHSLASNPQFVNASAGQFWLTSGSPGIHAGLNLGSPYDIGLMPGSTWPNSVVTGDQNAYGSGWEIGAFIYVPAVAPPSNLQVSVH